MSLILAILFTFSLSVEALKASNPSSNIGPGSPNPVIDDIIGLFDWGNWVTITHPDGSQTSTFDCNVGGVVICF